MSKKYEITRDDTDFRAEQQRRMLESVEKLGGGMKQIGDFVEETKKLNKINLWMSVAFVLILVSLVIGSAVIIGLDDIRLVFRNPSSFRNIMCDDALRLMSFEEYHYYQLSTGKNCTILRE